MKLIAAFICISAFISCNNKADTPVEEKDTAVVTTFYSWQSVLNDSSGRLEMKKVETRGDYPQNAPLMISFLNTQNPNIKLEYVKTGGDTLYLKIPDAEYLTQRMGSTGPTLYFSTVVYTLTELPGIKNISFDFDEGDHASPGTYNRESFKDE